MSSSPLEQADPAVFDILARETARQNDGLELIASENFVSPAVLQAMGSTPTNKYAEGLPGKRYYGGCDVVDEAEQLAIDRAKKLFGADWVNVQPHSGATANSAVFLAFMKPGERLLGLDLAHGGHLTHGSPVNFSGLLYEAHFYGVEKDGPEAGRIRLETVRKRARDVQPTMISVGASAYSRDFDYASLREIADEVGALLWVDMAHTAGLIAGGLLHDPLPHAHVVTTTTHKTLRGPRGGMVLVGNDVESPTGATFRSGKPKTIGQQLDSAIFPGTIGGPLMHIIAAKAVSFKEALDPAFKEYGRQVIANASAMADAFLERGYDVVSGGTDNHLALVDLRSKGLTGKEAEALLGDAGITVNKNMVPYDTESPFVTSGIRLGSPALTTRGFDEDDFRAIVALIDWTLESRGGKAEAVAAAVKELCHSHPLYENPIGAPPLM